MTGVDAELHVLEAMPHGGFMGNPPEDRDLADEVARFAHALREGNNFFPML